jgi:periplasmic protein TonB
MTGAALITGNGPNPDLTIISCTSLKPFVMTGNEILKADLLDILFDNRNKDYGAYRLRKFYNGRLLFSLTLSLSSVLFLFYFFGSVDSKSAAEKDNDVVTIQHVVIPDVKKKIEIEKPRQSVASKAPAPPQKRFVDRIEIVSNSRNIDQKMPPNNSVTDQVSDKDFAGVPGAPRVPNQVNTSGGGTGTKPAEETNEVPLISHGPEFPGGPQAWLRFLNRNLRVPQDLEPGEKKTVLIRFEVGVDGSVTTFQVVQSGGREYDEEVMRVLRKMPRWKPAMQSSQPVAVAFTQPVTFMGE